ncbi:MAG: restriction endonuclease subunit S [Acidobacteriota bacterium]|nr:restriction endonuclease subunit S [Acidobacteriota bacterium]
MVNEVVTLRDLILESRDGDWGKDQPKEGFVPYRVIRGGDFPRVEQGQIETVPRCYLKSSNVARRTLKPNDLLIETAGGTRDCSTGRVLFISSELLSQFDLPVTCASFARFLRLDVTKVNPKYIFWLLRLMHMNGEMWQYQVQHTGVARFQFSVFADTYDLLLPNRLTQDNMVLILEPIEKKLLLNHQMNKTLEAIAQAIFKSWFVDFDPVKAKAAAVATGKSSAEIERAAMAAISGKSEDELENLSESQRQSLAKTAALFPASFVDSELGKIPLGWRITTLGKVSSELRRGISPKYITEGGIQVINQRCIRNHTIDFSLCKRNDPKKRKVERRKIEIGDVLINSTGVGTLGRVAPVRRLEEHFVVTDSHVTVVRALKDEISSSYLAEFLLYKESYIESIGAGSTGQTELRKQALSEILLCLPQMEVQYLYEKTIKPFGELFANNEKQSKTLAQLRDTLLPKLLSGELSIPEAKAQAEGVSSE